MNEPLKTLDKVADEVKRDTYLLARADIDSIIWKIEELKDYIDKLYIKKGKDRL